MKVGNINTIIAWEQASFNLIRTSFLVLSMVTTHAFTIVRLLDLEQNPLSYLYLCFIKRPILAQRICSLLNGNLRTDDTDPGSGNYGFLWW